MPDATPCSPKRAATGTTTASRRGAGRKVGHATLCADDADELVERLQRVGRALDREDQVAPVIAALNANGTAA